MSDFIVPFESNFQVPSTAVDTSVIATRAYVDATFQNLDWKNSVRAISAAALPAYTRVGNVITANANGALAAVNGITLLANNRLALKDGAAGADNGLYSVTQVGTGSLPFILTRATDADSSAKFTARLAFEVEEGTNAGLWHCTNTGTITLNTTSITLAQFSGGASLGTDVADIQPVGTANVLGASDSAAPINHAHKFAISGQTTGDIIYFDGTNWVRLAKDTNGKYLTLSSGFPTWATVPTTDLTAPGPIGGTTPAAGTFTTLTAIQSSVGTAQTPAVTLQNATAAALGAQQYSPGLVLEGRGWSTGSSASQASKWLFQDRPVQGATLTHDLVLWGSVNGAAYSEILKITDGNGTPTLIRAPGFFTISNASGDLGVNAYAGLALSSTTSTVSITSAGSSVTASGASGLILQRNSVTLMDVGNTTPTAVTMAAGKSFSAAAGASAFSWGSATGDTTFGTGALTLLQAANKNWSISTNQASGTGTGTLYSIGVMSVGSAAGITFTYGGGFMLDIGTTTSTAVTVRNNINLVAAAGTSTLDWSAASGVFKTSTGAVSINGSATMATGTKLTLDSGTATGSGLAVTLNKQVGVITTEALTTGAQTSDTYTVTNSLVSSSSRIFCQPMKGSNTVPYALLNVTPGTGSFTIQIYNLYPAGGGALNGTVVFSFLIL